MAKTKTKSKTKTLKKRKAEPSKKKKKVPESAKTINQILARINDRQRKREEDAKLKAATKAAKAEGQPHFKPQVEQREPLKKGAEEILKIGRASCRERVCQYV